MMQICVQAVEGTRGSEAEHPNAVESLRTDFHSPCPVLDLGPRLLHAPPSPCAPLRLSSHYLPFLHQQPPQRRHGIVDAFEGLAGMGNGEEEAEQGIVGGQDLWGEEEAAGPGCMVEEGDACQRIQCSCSTKEGRRMRKGP